MNLCDVGGGRNMAFNFFYPWNFRDRASAIILEMAGRCSKARGGIVNFIVERGELVSVEAYLPRPTHIYIIIKHCNARLMHTFSYSKPCFRPPYFREIFHLRATLSISFSSVKISCCFESARLTIVVTTIFTTTICVSSGLKINLEENLFCIAF